MSDTLTFLETLKARDAGRGPEPTWIAARRQAGAARFEAMGFPTRRDEEWKYTNVLEIARGNFALANDATFSPAAAAALTLPLDGYRLSFVDGIFAPALSDVQGMPDGVEVVPLSQALEDNHEAVGGTLGRLTGVDFPAFSALNTAFMEEGAVVRLAAGCVVEKPIVLQFLSRVNVDKPTMCHPRILVEAGSRSEATIVEHHTGDAEATNFTNIATEMFLGRGAILTHYKLQEAPLGDFHIASIHVEQERDSRYVSHNMDLGGALVRNDLISELNGKGAEATFNGLFFGQGRQHVDNHTKVNHNAPLTFSNENYKGILDDRAHGVFNGRVYVKRDSQQIEGFQSNQNLLLSDRARVDTKPELEIYADDVKCTHGTTTGQLDEDAVFALRTRGLDEQSARGLLTLAFAGEVLEAVTLDAISERVELAVAGKLPERFNLAGLVETAAALND
ncbi:MAG: Fe-S cluster assembly protein SufD [Halomonas sp.]|nr:Fe-S cluster assembly protein SufD [Halomonas sp.]MDN6296520.1 Fe-S cluster assembly protein SufD [Halomonas sp.]MDN6313873.1 Fe-S cluster assembly protein SufD [Halomonas sp.]MDN6335327.1 Fe-S cluster assembly protein SufD [Halomonas sp.]